MGLELEARGVLTLMLTRTGGLGGRRGYYIESYVRHFSKREKSILAGDVNEQISISTVQRDLLRL